MLLAARTLTVVTLIVTTQLATASAWAQQRFDVTLEVEPIVRGSSPGGPSTPGLAFTGAPIWSLIALSLVLLTLGATLVSRARDGRPAEAAA